MQRDLIATHNERVKLLSGFSNALGLGLIGFAVLRPLTEDAFSLTWLTAWWGAAGLAFHVAAHYILRRLRKVPDDDTV